MDPLSGRKNRRHSDIKKNCAHLLEGINLKVLKSKPHVNSVKEDAWSVQQEKHALHDHSKHILAERTRHLLVLAT